MYRVLLSSHEGNEKRAVLGQTPPNASSSVHSKSGAALAPCVAENECSSPLMPLSASPVHGIIAVLCGSMFAELGDIPASRQAGLLFSALECHEGITEWGCVCAGVPGGECGGAAAAGDGCGEAVPEEPAAARAADDPARSHLRHPGARRQYTFDVLDIQKKMSQISFASFLSSPNHAIEG